jgi:hypothetical protein
MPEIGERWAYRDKPRTIGGEFRPVEVLQAGPGRKKYRVRRLDGDYVGLDEWVSRARLVVPWDDAASVLADERSLLALLARQPEPLEAAVADAVMQVYFGSHHDFIGFDVVAGRPIVATVEDFDAHRDELPLPAGDLTGSPGAFIDRCGELTVGQEAAMQLARALCETAPDPIMERCSQEIARWRKAVVSCWIESEYAKEGGYRVDANRARQYLNAAEQSSAIVRSWCGVEAETAYDEREALRDEVTRLSRLIEETAG